MPVKQATAPAPDFIPAAEPDFIPAEAPQQPQAKQPQAPPPVDPGLASDMFKAGINAKMLDISPGTALQNADVVDQTLREHAGDYDQPLDPTIMNDVKVGFQGTIFGLKHREKMPDEVRNAGKVDEFVQGLATMVGDAPFMIAGGVAGAGAGAVAGSEAPVLGNVTLGAVGAGAGAFALPAAIREQLVLGIQQGEVKGFKDLMTRAAKTVWAGAKGAITGAATEAAGGLPVGVLAKSPLTAVAAKALYQSTAITTVGSLLDGKVPNADDFAKNAAMIVPLNLVTHGMALRGSTAKQAVMDTYMKDGTTPQETATKLTAQPPVKLDAPPGLVPAIKLGDQHLEANDGENHSEFSARVLGQKPVGMDDLEADPKLADKVLQQPAIHDQEVIDKAWQLKKEALERGDPHEFAEGDASAELGQPDNIAALYNRGEMKSGRGFSTPDGKFLTRDQAAAWTKENEPEVHDFWKNYTQKGNGFHSEDYQEARSRIQAMNVAEGEPDYKDMGPELAKSLAGAREYLNSIQASDKVTGFGKSLLRTLWVGPRNMLRAEGEQLVSGLKKMVPDTVDQEAISFMRDYSDNPEELRTGIDVVEAGSNEKLKAFIPAMKRALEPSPEMKEASDKLTEYFKKALSRSQQLGIFSSQIDPERYSPRMFQKALDDEENPTGIRRSSKFTQKTPNSIERKYGHILDAVESGETEAQTFNAFHETSIYSDRHATAVATKLFLTQLKNSEVGKFGTNSEHPKGWVQLSPGKRALEQTRAFVDPDGEAKIVSKSFYVPKAIADAMKPILEDSGTSQIGKALHLQSVTKGLELGLSVFHMKAMTVTAMNNMKMTDFVKAMHSDNSSPEFEEQERTGALYGLETTKTGPVYEAYKGLQEGAKATGLGRLAEAPVVKQVDAFAKKITDETFNVIQRKFKVQDFALKKAAWEARNPDATPAEHGEAMRGYAKEVNAAYGGLNWEVMGVSKGLQDVSRLFLLAPDWTFSNVANLKYAGEGGAAGQAARAFWTKSFITGFGMSAAASISVAAAGGSNTKDAFSEWAKQPENVYLGVDKDGKKMYTSLFFAGAPKDAIHLANRVMKEHSALIGLSEVIAGKSGPGLGALFGLASNKDYAGKPIADKKEGWMRDVDAAKFLGEKALPISGVSTAQTIAKALMDPTHEYSYKDILELAADAAGSPIYHEGGGSNAKAGRTEGRSKPRYSALRK